MYIAYNTIYMTNLHIYVYNIHTHTLSSSPRRPQCYPHAPTALSWQSVIGGRLAGLVLAVRRLGRGNRGRNEVVT